MDREKKPRRPKPEWKDYPRRYLVRTGNSVREIEADSKGSALAIASGGSTVFPEAALMGTHETRTQARNRLGW